MLAPEGWSILTSNLNPKLFELLTNQIFKNFGENRQFEDGLLFIQDSKVTTLQPDDLKQAGVGQAGRF